MLNGNRERSVSRKSIKMGSAIRILVIAKECTHAHNCCRPSPSKPSSHYSSYGLTVARYSRRRKDLAQDQVSCRHLDPFGLHRLDKEKIHLKL